MEYFSYIKSLHIIFVITWFAGLFYIPRLFIYFIEASSKPSPDKKILMDQFTLMMNRLWFVITWPSSVLAILFGFWMIVLVPNWLFENWMIAKLVFVAALVGYQLKTHFILKELQLGVIKYSSSSPGKIFISCSSLTCGLLPSETLIITSPCEKGK